VGGDRGSFSGQEEGDAAGALLYEVETPLRDAPEDEETAEVWVSHTSVDPTNSTDYRNVGET
jgi:hypothetical protein